MSPYRAGSARRLRGAAVDLARSAGASDGARRPNARAATRAAIAPAVGVVGVEHQHVAGVWCAGSAPSPRRTARSCRASRDGRADREHDATCGWNVSEHASWNDEDLRDDHVDVVGRPRRDQRPAELPGRARRAAPDASSMPAVSVVTVVFPLVPVTPRSAGRVRSPAEVDLAATATPAAERHASARVVEAHERARHDEIRAELLSHVDPLEVASTSGRQCARCAARARGSASLAPVGRLRRP
jgi:hypothetical protein